MKDFPLTIAPAGYCNPKSHGDHEMSSLYRIFWLENSVETNSRKILIQPPGSLRVPESTPGFSGEVVAFPEEFLLMFGFEDDYPFRIKAALPGPLVITVDLSNCAAGMTIERTIAGMKNHRHRLAKGPLLLSGYLKILLVSVSRLFQHYDEGQGLCADRLLFERFMHLVAQHNGGKKGMQTYARALSIRTDVLSDAVKRVSGYPASHHIYQHIIRTAKHAAIGSGSTMKEVAYGLGFKDVAHFSKFFRNKAGMTFTDYKKAYQLL